MFDYVLQLPYLIQITLNHFCITLLLRKKQILLLGDFNINLLKCDDEPKIASFMVLILFSLRSYYQQE